VCDNATNFCGEGGALYGANIFDYPSIGQIACLYTTPNPLGTQFKLENQEILIFRLPKTQPLMMTEIR
jgi:hypothetical protein